MNTKISNNKYAELLQKNIKKRRLFLNMTYQDLSDKTGISKSSLQRYENGGIKNISYDKMLKISEALEVPPTYFLQLNNDPTGGIDLQRIWLNQRDTYSLVKKIEKSVIDILVPSLVSNGYSIIQPKKQDPLSYIIAEKENEIWHIDTLYTKDVNKFTPGVGAGRQQFILRLGRLAIYNKPITKYSLVVEHRIIAKQLLELKPIHLNLDISIIVLTSNGYDELFFN